MKTIEVNIHTIRNGDTVIHNGVEKTISRSNYRHSRGVGPTIDGDSYCLGTKPVKKIIYLKP